MEFTELADYPLPAGQLTEWTPRLVDDESAWVHDTRPLSYLHEDYCGRGSTCHPPTAPEDGHQRGSWLGAAFEIPHRHDPDAVARALTVWMRRHEVFRTTVSETRDDDGVRLCRRSTSDVEVAGTVVGHMRTGTRVHEHLVGLFERLSPLQWPHCLAVTIAQTDSAEDSFVLVFGADHSVMDAYSMLLAIGEIQRIYECELAGQDPELPMAGSHLDFSVDERVVGQALDAEHRAVDVWSRFLARDEGRFPAFPLPVTGPSSSHRRHQSGTSSWVLSATQSDAINRRARESGHSMQSAVLAALALTTRTVAGADVTRFAMPMHTRNQAQYVSSVGWFVGMIPIEVDVRGVESFDDCLSRAGGAVTAHKDLAQFPYPRIAELIGVEEVPRFVVSYVDARFIPAAQDWSRWGARTLRGAAESDDEVYLWIVRSPKGISVSARFPSNPVATAGVHDYLNSFTAVLARLAAAGTDQTRLSADDLVAAS
ncbi:condensation domain-containing protein [Williamsia maris]|uniref:Condensation domain-containing protein n=1 Tax=Williamsia maris TaxID=72806 RepID=A0ABT1H7P8_9NOCA|nr:condensation domain-containing protein [Williamsia maris]MCP2174293.1 Condensation domain-containing protein [Williamsia maris]